MTASLAPGSRGVILELWLCCGIATATCLDLSSALLSIACYLGSGRGLRALGPSCLDLSSAADEYRSMPGVRTTGVNYFTALPPYCTSVCTLRAYGGGTQVEFCFPVCTQRYYGLCRCVLVGP